jgi:hypothetical protein
MVARPRAVEVGPNLIFAVENEKGIENGKFDCRNRNSKR